MADVVARALSALACGDDGRLTTVSQLTRSTVIGVCSRDRPASADCRARWPIQAVEAFRTRDARFPASSCESKALSG
jgi:hypothetical protein